jgi:hypothetical protein
MKFLRTWLNAHPINRVYVCQGLAFFAVWLIDAAIVYTRFRSDYDDPHYNIVGLYLGTFIAATGIAIGLLMGFQDPAKPRTAVDRDEALYRAQDRYHSMGPWRFWAYTFSVMMKAQLVFFITTVAFWLFLVFALVPLLFISVAVLFCVGLGRLLGRIAKFRQSAFSIWAAGPVWPHVEPWWTEVGRIWNLMTESLAPLRNHLAPHCPI